ncbi:MAG: hypothetical protein IT259_06670 [Saprospiraceae bacterium]|nr:hypothetical protein [Saprospiraceae bacterium]
MAQTTEKAALGLNDLSTFGKLRPGAVRVSVKRDIKSDELHAALDRILELHGCTGCGMNGLDIMFRQLPPINELFRDFKNIAGVESIGV